MLREIIIVYALSFGTSFSDSNMTSNDYNTFYPYIAVSRARCAINLFSM